MLLGAFDELKELNAEQSTQQVLSSVRLVLPAFSRFLLHGSPGPHIDELQEACRYLEGWLRNDPWKVKTLSFEQDLVVEARGFELLGLLVDGAPGMAWAGNEFAAPSHPFIDVENISRGRWRRAIFSHEAGVDGKRSNKDVLLDAETVLFSAGDVLLEMITSARAAIPTSLQLMAFVDHIFLTQLPLPNHAVWKEDPPFEASQRIAMLQAIHQFGIAYYRALVNCTTGGGQLNQHMFSRSIVTMA
jgi:hypothetical protein